MRHRLEYWAIWGVLTILGRLPRSWARWTAATLLERVFPLQPAWHRAALFNLQLAFPEWDNARRERVIRQMVRNLGYVVAEFARFPNETRADVEQIIVIDGEENFDAAERQGKGVLLLTGHLGNWELIPFARSV